MIIDEINNFMQMEKKMGKENSVLNPDSVADTPNTEEAADIKCEADVSETGTNEAKNKTKKKKKEPKPLKPFKQLNFIKKIVRVLYISLPFVMTLIVPYFDFRLMQNFLNGKYSILNFKLEMMNWAFFFIFIWIIAFITNRIRVGVISSTVLSLLLGLIDHYVLTFRSTPLMPWDILSVGTAVDVAGTYDYSLNKSSFYTAILYIILLAIEIAVAFMYRRRKLFKKWLSRTIFVIISAAAFIIYGNVQQSIPVMEWAEYYPTQYYPLQMQRSNGIMATLVFEIQYLKPKAPKSYEVDDVKADLKSYDTSKVENAKKYPNVVAIMNETWSDLDVLGLDIRSSQEVMPFTKSLMAQDKNTISGHCHVSVCGGNTANSEFEFITGNSMKFMPSGSIPFMSYIKDGAPSQFSWMQSLGYDTYYFHPNYETSWNRNKVYEKLKAGNIFFNDLDGDDNKVTGVEKFRTFTSDKFVFNRLEQLFDEKKREKNDRPFFTWTVTIQNHGGYSRKYPSFTPHIKCTNYDSWGLDTYLSLINLTDQDFSQLINYFKDYDEPTIVVMFGDHEPGDFILTKPYANENKDVKNLGEDDLKLRYETPYVIWANFPIEGAKDVDSSPNFLAAQTLQAAGIPTNDYQNFLLDLKKKIPFISTVNTEKADGVTDDEEEKLLNEYNEIEYYKMNDFNK